MALGVAVDCNLKLLLCTHSPWEHVLETEQCWFFLPAFSGFHVVEGLVLLLQLPSS